MKRQIYLDYSATTPVDPRVAEKMMQCLTMDGNFGNPASRSHGYGWEAEESVETARQQVADLVNADPREIVWDNFGAISRAARSRLPPVTWVTMRTGLAG